MADLQGCKAATTTDYQAELLAASSATPAGSSACVVSVNLQVLPAQLARQPKAWSAECPARDKKLGRHRRLSMPSSGRVLIPQQLSLDQIGTQNRYQINLAARCIFAIGVTDLQAKLCAMGNQKGHTRQGMQQPLHGSNSLCVKRL